MSAFRIKQDFVGLFTASPDGRSNYSPIEGLRAIYAILIVLFHQLVVVMYWLPNELSLSRMYGNPYFLPLGQFGMQVDALFVLSGFFLGKRLLRMKAWSARSYVDMVVSRAIRLWPAVIILLLYYTYQISGVDLRAWSHSMFFTFQYTTMRGVFPLHLLHQWSNAVDMHVYIVAPVAWYIGRKWLRLSPRWIFGLGMALAVYVRARVVYTYQVNAVDLVFSSPYVFRMESEMDLLSRTGNVGPHVIFRDNFTTEDAPIEGTLYEMFQKTYAVAQCRFFSFMAGAYVAAALAATRESLVRKLRFGLVAVVPLFLKTYMVLWLLVLPNIPRRLFLDRDPVEVEVFMTATSRSMYSAAVAILVYAVTVDPKVDPEMALQFPRKLLSSAIFRPFARLSYLMYMIQLAVMDYVFLQLLPWPDPKDIYLSSVWYPLLVYVFPLIMLVAVVLHVFVEEPLRRTLNTLWKSIIEPKHKRKVQ